jgi:hypothetical protein
MPTICSAEMFAAISDVPMAHQGCAGSEEIVLRVFLMRALFARHPLREYKNSDRVDRQNDDVQSCQIHVNPLLQRRRWRR